MQIDPRDDKGLIGKTREEVRRFIPNHFNIVFIKTLDDCPKRTIPYNELLIWLDTNDKVTYIT